MRRAGGAGGGARGAPRVPPHVAAAGVGGGPLDVLAARDLAGFTAEELRLLHRADEVAAMKAATARITAAEGELLPPAPRRKGADRRDGRARRTRRRRAWRRRRPSFSRPAALLVAGAGAAVAAAAVVAAKRRTAMSPDEDQRPRPPEGTTCICERGSGSAGKARKTIGRPYKEKPRFRGGTYCSYVMHRILAFVSFVSRSSRARLAPRLAWRARPRRRGRDARAGSASRGPARLGLGPGFGLALGASDGLPGSGRRRCAVVVAVAVVRSALPPSALLGGSSLPSAIHRAPGRIGISPYTGSEEVLRGVLRPVPAGLPARASGKSTAPPTRGASRCRRTAPGAARRISRP